MLFLAHEDFHKNAPSSSCAVYNDMEDLGREEAWQCGYINRNDELLMDKYFDYEKFGEDVVNEDEYFIEITHNRAVRISL